MMRKIGIFHKLEKTALLYRPLSRVCKFFSKTSPETDAVCGGTSGTSFDTQQNQARSFSSKMHLSPLFSCSVKHSSGYDIEVLDNDTWLASSGFAHGWQGLNQQRNAKFTREMPRGRADEAVSDTDFVDIEDMRVRGDLFYKLDRDSMEFEEYNFDYHRRKSSKSNADPAEGVKASLDDKIRKECRTKESGDQQKVRKVKQPLQISNGGRAYSLIHTMDGSIRAEKKERTPTFNQLTAPYHEPFCLDIYISKASVRACIVHCVTSKVVAVAHSISKDMKFDLSSTRNRTACTAVGKILAQRALADDIHDVVYTPRKGEKLEGKLQIVLQSILDNGINVKVKLKQIKTKKSYSRS